MKFEIVIRGSFFLVCIFIACSLNAQVYKGDYQWRFGYGEGLDFTSGSPVAVTGVAMSTAEGNSTIADASGNLLFYTDGITVWDANNNVMPNGNGLNGSNISAQSALIVPLPGSTTTYYIFTMNNWGDSLQGDGFCYSVVDMTLNGGKGDVTGPKNVLVDGNVREQQAAIISADGKNVWILVHSYNSASYRSYLLTSTGLNTTPVTSTVGMVYGGINRFGQLHFSRSCNTKVISVLGSQYACNETVQLCDFDNSTGVVSKPVTLGTYNTIPTAYGASFSGDNSKLYVTEYNSGVIEQFDLNSANVSASMTNVAPSNNGISSTLSLGPDNKIYVDMNGDNALSIIESPNTVGLACNFQYRAFPLNGNSCALALPDFMLRLPFVTLKIDSTNTVCNSNNGSAIAIVNPADLPDDYTYSWSNAANGDTVNNLQAGSYSVTATDTIGCSGTASTTILPSVDSSYHFTLGNDTTYCGAFSRVLSTGIANTTWSTGVTDSQIIVTSGGTYWAMVSNGCSTGADTIKIGDNPKPIVNLGDDTTLCTGGTLLLNATNTNSNYVWQDNSTGSTFSVSAAGTYSVTVTNNSNCSASGSIEVSYTSQPPVFTIGNDTSYCGTFTDTLVSGGQTNTIWSTGATGPQIVVSDSGSYWATESNACGVSTASIHIADNPLPVISLGNDTTLCTGEFLLLDAAGNADSVYQWQDNSTDSTFSVSVPGTYSVTVTNSFQCINSDSIAVFYDTQKPVFTLGPDTSFCGRFSFTLTSGIANSLWSTGVTAAMINVQQAGLYWAKASNACGSTSDSIVIGDYVRPQVKFTQSYATCPGDTILIKPFSSATHFLWSSGDTTPYLYISLPDIYSVEVYDTIICPDSAIVAVQMDSPPVISLGPDTSICGSTAIQLSLNVPGAHYLWQDNSTDSFYNVFSSGTYSVTATTNCGTTTAQRIVYIYGDDCALLFPTGFSPNNDGVNDLFRAHCHCPVRQFSMSVYNRWGDLVFTSNDIGNGWDGTFKGVPQQMGVFVYYAEYFNYCDNKIKQVAGNITLVR